MPYRREGDTAHVPSSSIFVLGGANVASGVDGAQEVGTQFAAVATTVRRSPQDMLTWVMCLC